MGERTSTLVIRLLDRLSGPAAKARGAITALDRTARSATGRRGVGGLATETGRAGSSMIFAGAKSIAAAAGMYGVARSAQRGVVELASFERRMARVGITAEATREQTAGAAREVKALANEVALPIDQVTSGLETLVAQGRSLPDAMKVLPQVARTAQAAGAEVEDIAKSVDAIGTHLRIGASDMQDALDLAVTGGKLGQFELKDQARYLPSLAPAAKAVGFEGKKGLSDLIAMLQVLRKGAGTSEEAAVSLSNILQKMNSEETSKRFEKFGIDIGDVLKKARDEGRNQIEAFEDALQKATGGDLALIPKIINDMEFARGMRALLSMRGAWQTMSAEMQRTAAGSTMRDLNRVVNDGQAAVDRLSTAWGNFWQSAARIGDSAGLTKALSEIASAANAVSDALDSAGKPGTAERSSKNLEAWGYETRIKQLDEMIRRRALGHPAEDSYLRQWRDEREKLQAKVREIDDRLKHPAPPAPAAAQPADQAKPEAAPDTKPTTQAPTTQAPTGHKLSDTVMGRGPGGRTDGGTRTGISGALFPHAEPQKPDRLPPAAFGREQPASPVTLPWPGAGAAAAAAAAAAGKNAARAFEDALAQGLASIAVPEGRWPDQSTEAASAAERSTEAFVQNLEAGLRQAEAAVQSSVARMMGMLSFKASPSITPRIAPAPAGATPTRAQGSSSSPTPTRTAARGVYADYDNAGDLDFV